MKTEQFLGSPHPAPSPAERIASPTPEQFWRACEVPCYIFPHHLNSRTNCDVPVSARFSPRQLPYFQHLDKRVRNSLKTGNFMSLCFAEHAHSFRASPLFAALTQNTPVCIAKLEISKSRLSVGFSRPPSSNVPLIIHLRALASVGAELASGRLCARRKRAITSGASRKKERGGPGERTASSSCSRWNTSQPVGVG